MLQEGAIINKGSEAFEYLHAVLNHPSTYKVSLDIRANGIAIKQNESMWTATLSTR